MGGVDVMRPGMRRENAEMAVKYLLHDKDLVFTSWVLVSRLLCEHAFSHQDWPQFGPIKSSREIKLQF